MTPEDLAMIAAMSVVPLVLVASLALAALAIGRAPRRGRRAGYAVAGASLLAVMSAGVVSTFWLWGVGFEYADTFRQPPAYVEPTMLLGISVAGAAYAGLLVTGLLAHRAHLHLRTRPDPRRGERAQHADQPDATRADS